MSVGKKGIYNLYLRDVPTSPATEVGLVLDLDEQGAPRVSESRVEPGSPRQSQGAIDWTQGDPMVDFVWAMDDWGDGGLRPYYRNGDHRYGVADGVDARWRGVLALNMRQDLSNVGFFVPNSGWESGAAGDWTFTQNNGLIEVAASGASLAVRSGSYALRIQGPATMPRADYTIPTWVPAANEVITFGVWARRQPNAGGTNVLSILIIEEGVGNTQTNSNALDDTYTFVTVTRTCSGGGTGGVTLRITAQSLTGAINVDDMVFRRGAADTCVGVVEAAGTYYSAVGPFIFRLNTSTSAQPFWEFSRIEALSTAATSIVSYNDKVYVGYGASAAYVYGTHGSWTAASGSADNDNAIFMTVVGDILWKTTTTTNLQHLATSEDPAAATGSWVGENVTDSGSPITGLYELNGGVVVGTERGLLAKNRFEPEFLPVYTPFSTDPDSENFQRGAKKDGWLYLTTAKQGLIRYNGVRVEDLSEVFTSPRHTNFGGRVRAVASDPNQVWCLVDTPALDASITKTTRLMSLREVEGRLALHPMFDVDVADINALAVAGSHLYAIGRLSLSAAGTYYMNAQRWWLPLKSVAPYQDEIGGRWLESSGYIELPVWHGGLPDTQKALYKATAWVADTSSTNYITVSFGVDGAVATTTNFGGTSGDGRLDTTATIQTLEASDQTAPSTTNVGRSFAVRLTFTRNTGQTDPSSTRASGTHESPKLYAIAFHYSLRPDRVRRWECYVRLGARLRNDMADPVSISAQLAALDTLETQVYPIELEHDFDQDDTLTTVAVVIRQLERVFEAEERKRPGLVGELYRLVLQEVT